MKHASGVLHSFLSEHMMSSITRLFVTPLTSPSAGSVASSAIGAVAAIVVVIIPVASVTCCWSAVPDVVHMASGAGRRSVSACQRERGGRMVDRSPCPGSCIVTLGAGLADGG